MKTVASTVQAGLCCSCGVCKGICPQNCIEFIRRDGLFLPAIDKTACISCGLCAAVCPGLGHTYEPKTTAEDTVTGPVLECFNAWSRDADLRHVSASGGVASTLIRELLGQGRYDGVFCLDSYDYREQLKSRLYTPEEVSAHWAESNAPKSRYLTVSHENALRYMKENREKRLILVGTSCAVRGLQAAIRKLNLKREQYLFIGLFCDKVFNYNVLSYFRDAYAGGREVRALHFKNKESGGWPGDMKFFPEIGDPFYVPLSERAKAKVYFMPERCLYCVDKLNACADISLGDNYTGQDDSLLGSNSVILRTDAGRDAWNCGAALLEIRPVKIADIQRAQAIDMRMDNLYYGLCKTGSETNLNDGVPCEKNPADFSASWQRALKKLRAGAVYDSAPAVLKKQLRRDQKKPNILLRAARKVIRCIRRAMQ